VEELKRSLLFVALFSILLLPRLFMGSYTKSYNGCRVNPIQLVSFEPRYPKPDFRVLDATNIIVTILLTAFMIGMAIKLLKKD
jgi:hypothetical protein